MTDLHAGSEENDLQTNERTKQAIHINYFTNL